MPAEFLLVVKFEVREGSSAQNVINIAEAWGMLQDRFGSANVERRAAGVFDVREEVDAGGYGVLRVQDLGSDEMMKPAWEDLKRRRFELEKHGMVQNDRKPSVPTHAELAVWGPILEERVIKDPAGRARSFKGAKWVSKMNAALREKGLGPLIGSNKDERMRFYNSIRAIFGDQYGGSEVIWNDGSNMYTSLVWRDDVP